MKRRLGINPLAFISIALLCGTTSVRAEIDRNARFDHYTIEDGLSQSTVDDVLQDHRGFMWFATQDGLNRFDGHSVKIYRVRTGDPTGLSNGFIYDILEDRLGNLWAATEAGLNRYDREHDVFINERIVFR